MLSSNPTASTGVDRCQRGEMQTPSVLATQRDSKNDSIFGARREIQRRTTLCTEPAWTHQNSKAIGQECEKPIAAKRVESRAVLRTGQEPNFCVFSLCF
jgi:hypothetical protein